MPELFPSDFLMASIEDNSSFNIKFICLELDYLQDAQDQMKDALPKRGLITSVLRAKMDKSMFVKIKTLGIGAFGEVCLARRSRYQGFVCSKNSSKKDVLLKSSCSCQS